MRKLKLRGIVLVTALSIILTGCQTSNNIEESNKENQVIVEQNPIERPTIGENIGEIFNDKENRPQIEETIPSQSETESVPVPEISTQTKENFTFFEEAKQEIVSYIESDDFENLKAKGKYYVTTGIDFIFFDVPINGIYFDDLTEQLKQDIIRDVKALDESIMAYFPNYKETISDKYKIATEFLSDKYYDVLDYIKEYLGEENYNAVGDIKDQILGDISNKSEEIIDDIKDLYQNWKK